MKSKSRIIAIAFKRENYKMQSRLQQITDTNKIRAKKIKSVNFTESKSPILLMKY